MAQIVENGGGDSGKGKKRPKKSSTHVDMTPMVDLAFLLLTFFVLTSTFSKPKVMSLVYPAKDVPESTEKPVVKNAITFLITKDRVFYYKGEFNPTGGPKTELIETDFGPQGVRKLLAKENEYVIREKLKLDGQLTRKEIVDSVAKQKLIEAQKTPQALKVLVKTDLKALCANFIDLIDELYIANIGMIAPVDIMKDEQALIDAKIK
jgi:biopolymer transport protein ExbD